MKIDGRQTRRGAKSQHALEDLKECTHPLNSKEWRVKFLRHRCQAKYRDEPYKLTYDDFLTVWYDSKQWQRAGLRKNTYQMKRLDAKLPWQKDNVIVVQHHWRLTNTPIHSLTYSVSRYADADLVKK
tara:strand:+ start:2113 stop:2493 length:381 start_codon:yes stop_codon:yes gene_type:complete